jgi:hypothetical protein
MAESFVMIVVDQATDDVDLGRVQTRTNDVVWLARQVDDVFLRLAEWRWREGLKRVEWPIL